MSVIHGIAAAVSAMLFVYLLLALMKPEWFS